MNFTYDLTNIFGSLINFATDKEFGNIEDSGNNPLKLKKKEFIKKLKLILVLKRLLKAQ